MRIITGLARGRKIDAPAGRETRPTLDRVKEAMFGSIQFGLAGAAVLDLFSGSGNLGLEAVSRGAALAVLNDFDKKAVAVISANVEKLGFGGSCEVCSMDYAACLLVQKQKGRRFDFIFLDPPYRAGLAQDAVKRIFALGLLKEGGKILLESSAKDESEYEGRLLARKKYGDTAVSFLSWAICPAEE